MAILASPCKLPHGRTRTISHKGGWRPGNSWL